MWGRGDEESRETRRYRGEIGALGCGAGWKSNGRSWGATVRKKKKTGSGSVGAMSRLAGSGRRRLERELSAVLN